MKWAPELAEAIGAFTIVLVGCGAIMVNAVYGGIGTLGIAVAFGLAVASMIHAVGHVSGAHFNPAVTLAFALTRHFPARRIPSYIMAQLVGGILAALVLRLILPDAPGLGETVPALGLTTLGAVLVEFVITAMLMFVIASVATDGRAVGRNAAGAIGGVVLLGALWAGPLTGAGMNPMRSVAPALVAGTLDGSIWIYIVAPVVGAAAGAALYEATRRGERPQGVRA